MQLFLIRHGETPTNVVKRLETRVPGPDLTPTGREQADALAASFVSRRLDAVYVSPLVRTHQTAAPLLQGRDLVAVELPGLLEIEAGELEGHDDRAAVERYHGTIGAWVAGDLDRAMPGAITGRTFLDRFDGAVERIATAGDEVVVAVSSGAAIRAWVGLRVDNVDLAFVADHVLGNTGVVELQGSPDDGWTCVAWEGAGVTAGATDAAGGVI
ncbi:histidine phosphatase family protein [Curtobacterium sp. MCBD17_013]|uniref:histidine phosphatase family protein n=1 Tax=Curtobacterium sp. MCBD17_013 TaxID=2175668 RepID=UPI000DA96FE0|nr:histidine phosphatase family protein [Curtobacterium sp. MCBD17_013]PZF65064.1 histidine phosphatase family protein [Curtobacterium sp. MCBD17_013]